MLISTDQLAAHLNDPDWVIFDCRHDLMDHEKGERVYRAAHIPNAHFAPMETALSGKKTGTNGRHPLPAPNDFAEFLARHGVKDSTTLVAYDDAGGLYAARLWWMARWIGLKHGALLDGGLTKWLAEKRPVTAEMPVAKPARSPVRAKADSSLVWSVDDVLHRMGDSDCALIDARTAERFRGDVETIDPVAGHIPGALNRFYKANLKPDLTFRPPDEVKQEFEVMLAGRRPGNVAHQCGSGVTACANLFAMEYAGLSGSKLYAGSWSEWIADPSRPVARG